MNTFHDIEVRRLFVRDVCGHDLVSQAPTDLVLRAGDAEFAKTIRFVTHDGEKYNDVAFVSSDALHAKAISTPKVCCYNDGLLLTEIEMKTVVKNEEDCGSVSFNVVSGFETVCAMCLDGEGVSAEHMKTSSLSVGAVCASELIVETYGTTVAEFKSPIAAGHVRVVRDEVGVCLDAARIGATTVEVDELVTDTMVASRACLNDLTVSHLTVGDCSFEIVDDRFCIEGCDVFEVETIRAQRIEASEIVVTDFHVIPVGRLFMEFDDACIKRHESGGVAWCGDVCTDTILTRDSELDIRANMVRMCGWSIDTSSETFAIRSDACAIASLVLGTNCRLGCVRITGDDVKVPNIESEHHRSDIVESESVVAHRVNANDLSVAVGEVRQLRTRDMKALSVTTDSIYGVMLEISAEVVSIDCIMHVADVAANDVNARDATFRELSAAGVSCTELHSKSLTVGASPLLVVNNTCVGINTNAPTVPLDVNGDTMIRERLNVCGAAFFEESVYVGGHRIAFVGDALCLDEGVHVVRDGLLVNTSSGRGALCVAAKSDEPHILLQGVTDASIRVNDRMLLECGNGVEIANSLSCCDVFTDRLHVQGGIHASSACFDVKRSDDVSILRVCATGMGVNAGEVRAGIDVRLSSTHAFVFEGEAESYVGELCNGLHAKAHSFSWKTPGAVCELTDTLMSVSCPFSSPAITACDVHAGEVMFEGASISSSSENGVSALRVDAAELKVVDTLSSCRVMCGATPGIAVATAENAACIAMRQSKVSIDVDASSIVEFDSSALRSFVPIISPDVVADRVILNGREGARISLDYSQIDALSRVSNFIRVERPDETFTAAEEAAFSDLFPSGLFDEGIELDTRRGRGAGDIVVLADTVRIDGAQLLSSVPIVAAKGVDVNDQRIINLRDPVNPGDAVSFRFLVEYVRTVESTGVESVDEEPVRNTALRVNTTDTDVGILESSGTHTRLRVSNTHAGANVFATFGDESSGVSLGHTDSKRFVISRGDDLRNPWMSMRSESSYSETTFTTHVRLQGNNPLLTMTRLVSGSPTTVLQMAPHQLHLGPPGSVSIENVYAQMLIKVNRSDVMRVSSGLVELPAAGSRVRASQLQLGDERGVILGRSNDADVFFSNNESKDVFANIGTNRMWNVYHTGSGLHFDSNGHGLVETFSIDGIHAGQLEYDFSNTPGSAGEAFSTSSTPAFVVHRHGACINARSVDRGLVVGDAITLNDASSAASTRLTCDSAGTLTCSNNMSFARFACERVSADYYDGMVSTPALSTSTAYIHELSTPTVTCDVLVVTDREEVQSLSVHNLFVSGALEVTERLRIPDPFIQLAVGNTSDVTDTGIAIHYKQDDSDFIAGLVRDSGTKRFVLYDNLAGDHDVSGYSVELSGHTAASLDVKNLQADGIDVSSDVTASNVHASAAVTALSVHASSEITSATVRSSTMSTAALHASESMKSGKMMISTPHDTSGHAGEWEILNECVQVAGTATWRNELQIRFKPYGSTASIVAFRIREPEL